MAGTVIALGVLSVVVVGTSAAVLAFVCGQLRPAVTQLSARELRDVGSRALASVVAARRTDGVRNHLNVQCRIDFLICPADGSEPFPVEREMVIPADAVPHPGDTWPAWYLPEDRSQVLVAAPATRHVVARSQPGRSGVRDVAAEPADEAVDDHGSAEEHNAA